MLCTWDFLGQRVELKDGRVVDVMRIVGGPLLGGKLGNGEVVQFDWRDIVPSLIGQWTELGPLPFALLPCPLSSRFMGTSG